MLYMSNFTVFMHIHLPPTPLGLVQTRIHIVEASSTWMIRLLVSYTSCGALKVSISCWAWMVSISCAWAWKVKFLQPWRLLTRVARAYTWAAVAHRHLRPRPPHLGWRTSSQVFWVTFHHQHLLEIGDKLVGDGHPPTSPLKLSEDHRVSPPLLLPSSPFSTLLWHLLPARQAWELNEEPDEAEDDGEDRADGEQEQPPPLPHALACCCLLLWLRMGGGATALWLWSTTHNVQAARDSPLSTTHSPSHTFLTFQMSWNLLKFMYL